MASSCLTPLALRAPFLLLLNQGWPGVLDQQGTTEVRMPILGRDSKRSGRPPFAPGVLFTSQPSNKNPAGENKWRGPEMI